MIVPIQNNEKNLTDICNIISDLESLFKVDCNITAVTDGLFLMELREFDAPHPPKSAP